MNWPVNCFQNCFYFLPSIWKHVVGKMGSHLHVDDVCWFSLIRLNYYSHHWHYENLTQTPHFSHVYLILFFHLKSMECNRRFCCNHFYNLLYLLWVSSQFVLLSWWCCLCQIYLFRPLNKSLNQLPFQHYIVMSLPRPQIYL